MKGTQPFSNKINYNKNKIKPSEQLITIKQELSFYNHCQIITKTKQNFYSSQTNYFIFANANYAIKNNQITPTYIIFQMNKILMHRSQMDYNKIISKITKN